MKLTRMYYGLRWAKKPYCLTTCLDFFRRVPNDNPSDKMCEKGIDEEK